MSNAMEGNEEVSATANNESVVQGGGRGIEAHQQESRQTVYFDAVQIEDKVDARNNENTTTRSGDEASRCHTCMMRGPFCRTTTTRWPRTMALTFGVIIPLFSLIAFAIFFGLFLAQAEGRTEVENNDAVLANAQESVKLLQAVSNFSTVIPVICLELFLAGRETSLLEGEIRSRILNQTESTILNSTTINEFLSGDLAIVNTTNMYYFMGKCGEGVETFMDRMFKELLENAVSNGGARLTFDWIRCVPGAGNLAVSFGLDTEIEEMRYKNQRDYFHETWKTDQERLFRQYRQQMNDTNSGGRHPVLAAYERSLVEATGLAGCSLNVAGTSWFWFTVMTTIGYGNQAPVTPTGRTMVFTLGFLSVLAFGGVLATAGFITLAIWEDIIARVRLHWLNLPSIACFFWGGLWYTWMICIAWVTKRWKSDRLGQGTPPLGQTYWFAYISTTTVGLGDIFLEPEVLIGRDLLTFPLLFLVGFVFLAAFLGKFSEMLRYWILGRGKKSTVEILIDKLQHTAPIHLPLEIPGSNLTTGSSTPDTKKEATQAKEEEEEDDIPDNKEQTGKV